MKSFQQFDFPGNVRQLENFCHWLTVMAPGQTVNVTDLPPEIQAPQVKHVAESAPIDEPAAQLYAPVGDWTQLLGKDAEERLVQSQSAVWSNMTQEFEKAILQAALKVCRGRRVEAASRLGMGRNTITRKLRELGMDSASID